MIRRFNRYEIKYAVPVKELPKLKPDLERFLGRDEYGGNNGYYSIASLYFDTPDLDCYRNKLDGLLFRRKLRIRIYPDRMDGPAFVEIKQRVNRTVQKRRLPMTLADAYELCAGGTKYKLAHADDQEIADEVHFLVKALRLRPKNVIAYTRQAYVGQRVDPGMRLTFDTMIRTRRAEFDLEQFRKTKLALPATLAVMEVKANERVPHWLISLLARHQCTLSRISKYCHGMSKIMEADASTRTILPKPQG